MSLKDEILSREDPIKDLVQVVMDLIMEDDDILRSTHLLVCRDMGLHPDTMIGSDRGDGYEHYIEESDPRYDLYWATLANLHHAIFAQLTEQEKFRWTLAHHQSMLARKVQSYEVPQTADINEYLKEKGWLR